MSDTHAGPTIAVRSMDSGVLVILRELASRFALCFWTLLAGSILVDFVVPIDWITSTISSAYQGFAVWVGESIIGLPRSRLNVAFNGSGDRTIDWVRTLSLLVVGAAFALGWMAADRRTNRWPKLRSISRVLIRYELATAMLFYGVNKLFVLQFPPPSPIRLSTTFGDASPMGLLWTFMGASPAYVFFSGLAETIGGILLFSRRTTLLGALVVAGVMTNVVMLNFCYDVPVKIYSSMFLLMALSLIAADARRLLNVVLLNQATQPSSVAPRIHRGWLRWSRRALKTVVIGYLVFTNVKADYIRGTTTPKTWYDLGWDVMTFHRNGVELPLSLHDKSRWRGLRFDAKDGKIQVRWRFGDRTYGDFHDVVIDETSRMMTLTPRRKSDSAVVSEHKIAYSLSGPDRMTLRGKVGTDEIVAELERHGSDSSRQTRLMSRGFHWVNEFPYSY